MKPTESELRVLQILWQSGPCSVRVVNEAVNEDREEGYTTTLKIMQIMLDKGLVSRNTDQRTHIYAAAVAEDQVQRNLLDIFLDTTFRGSAGKLVLQALGNHRAEQEELDAIKALIEKLENTSSKSPDKQ